MTMTKSEKIRLYYGIFLGVLTAVIGALFIISAADIYFSGPNGAGKNYTREIVGEKLSNLLIPVCFWIAAIVAGFVLSVVYPNTNRVSVRRDARDTMKRLSRRMPQEGDPVCYDKYRRAERTRIAVYIVCAIVCLFSAVVSGIYLFNAAHFPAENLNAEVLKMLANVLPWVAVAFVTCIGVSVYNRISSQKELPLMKRLIASGKGSPLAEPSAFERKKSAVSNFLGLKQTKLALRLAALALGVTFVIVGIYNGGAGDVLRKAINICTECIGLG